MNSEARGQPPASVESPSPGLAQVRGTAFLGIIKHLKAIEQPIDRVVELARPSTRRVLSDRVRVLGWYPYDAFVGLLHAVDAELGAGDLAYCRTLGEEASKMDLNSVFRFLAKLSAPERLIRSCGRVWGQYYRNAGRMEAIAWEPERTVLRIYGFPQMDPGHCQLMAGWMMQSMRLIGASVADDAEPKCTSRGDPFHEFVCHWTR